MKLMVWPRRYRPLKMLDTGFRPSRIQTPLMRPRPIPDQRRPSRALRRPKKIDNRILRGVVHDRPRYMAVGWSRDFHTAADLARYAECF